MKVSTFKYKPYFEQNIGQLPINVKYKLKTYDYTTFFEEDKLIVSLPSNMKQTRNVFYMVLENKSEDTKIKCKEKQDGIVNYLIGNDRSKWVTDIPTYSKIKYENIYENIDLYYYINDKDIEYDFVLAKGANPDDICISFEGIDHIEINENMDIVLTVGDVKASLLKPQVYQIIDDTKVKVDCSYTIEENKFVNFLIGEYEKEYELVLDPIIKFDYSTYIGGINTYYGRDIAVDNDGCAYITGYTSGDYPTTTGQTTYGGGLVDGFVTKLSADGSSLVYSTYLGGEGADYPKGIVVDQVGYAYVTGGTESSDFPTTSNSYQTKYGGNSDVFITKIDTDGKSLIYSTFIGGSGYETANKIAIDSDGCVYITGKAENKYPVTTGAYQTTFGGQKDAFVTKIGKNGEKLIYSTYLGGSSLDCGNGIVVDSEGYAYVTGYTEGTFPTTKGAYQTTLGGQRDVFVSKISLDGSSLIYSTYIGGWSFEQGSALAVDNEGCAYVVGKCNGNGYPTMNAYKDYSGSSYDAIFSKLSRDGSSLIYSTYFGSKENENAYAVAVDSEGYAYITGYWRGDIFLTKLSKDGKTLVYSSSLNDGDDDYGCGITLDSKGCIYIVGYSGCDYITTEGAYQTTGGPENNVIVSKIMLLDYNLVVDYKPIKSKLLDKINTKLIFKNLNQINLDINIKYQSLNSSLAFVENSLVIQGVNQLSTTIPQEIYLSNIEPQKTAEIKLGLKCIKDIFPNKIPVKVVVELYDTRTDIRKLLTSTTKTFYIDTVIGPNYIPGCNDDLYNLEINGEFQTDASGAPIIYYKYGNSYIYRKSVGTGYVYSALLNLTEVVEHKIY